MADGVDSRMYDFGAGKSAIRTVFEQTCELRQQGVHDFWDFSIGNPDVPAPPAVDDAIREVLAELDPIDVHGYPPNNGWLTTRQAVAANLNRRFGACARASEIAMTGGCAGAITATIAAVTSAGEDVIVPVPYFAEYRMYIQAWNCRCVEVPTLPRTFQLDLDAIERAIGPTTRMVIVNTPNNPTGAIYTDESLRELGALLRRKSRELGQTIYLLSDEPYREIVYDGRQSSWVADHYENTIVCYSWSKSLSLAGERVGYVWVPSTVRHARRVYDAILGAQRVVNSICNGLFCRVIERCVDLPAPVAAYERKRDALYAGLTRIGYDVVHPDGAFYLWVRALERDDDAFQERAANEERLFVVGSEDFAARGYFRLSYCVSDDAIEKSLPAFERLFHSYGGYQWQADEPMLPRLRCAS